MGFAGGLVGVVLHLSGNKPVRHILGLFVYLNVKTLLSSLLKVKYMSIYQLELKSNSKNHV